MTARANKSDLDRLLEQFDRYPSLESFQLYRNMYFGAATACLVLVVQLANMGTTNVPLRLSLWCAGFAMPIWLCLGGILEYYIVLGPKSYGHRRTVFARNSLGAFSFLAGIALAASIGLLLYKLLPWAAYIFAGSIGIAIGFSFIYGWHLARWYYRKPGEEAGSPRA